MNYLDILTQNRSTEPVNPWIHMQSAGKDCAWGIWSDTGLVCISFRQLCQRAGRPFQRSGYRGFCTAPGYAVATNEITRTLPRELKGELPQAEEIAALLEGIEQW